MLADHSTPHNVQIILLGLGVLIFALAYTWATWRRGKLMGTAQLLEIAEQERDLLRERSTRLEGELAEQRERHNDQINGAREDLAKLQGIVEQQRTEIEQLRKLVMLETVPTPLVTTMQQVADQVAERIIRELKEGNAA